MSLRTIAEKATRLQGRGQVHEITPARAFHVQGDHGTYTVYLRDMETAQCTCPADGVCAHIGAAMLEADATDNLVLAALQ